MSYLDDAAAKIAEFEGCVPWMYLDTVGEVTCAVGRALPSTLEAAALEFDCPDGSPATPEEIAAEWARVHGMTRGLEAEDYRIVGSLELQPETMQAMLYVSLHGIDGSLSADLWGYAAAPDAAKLALLDLAYNLGVAGLMEKFPGLVEAVRAGDWMTSAKRSARLDVSDARNEWTRMQFIYAYRTTGAYRSTCVYRETQ
jgi:GH24 family phage-related lysozyme (muramidase)